VTAQMTSSAFCSCTCFCYTSRCLGRFTCMGKGGGVISGSNMCCRYQNCQTHQISPARSPPCLYGVMPGVFDRPHSSSLISRQEQKVFSPRRDLKSRNLS
jgi:hypothetical protein